MATSPAISSTTSATTSRATTESLRELEQRLAKRLPGPAHFDSMSRVLSNVQATSSLTTVREPTAPLPARRFYRVMVE